MSRDRGVVVECDKMSSDLYCHVLSWSSQIMDIKSYCLKLLLKMLSVV